jgi:membrane protein
MDDLQARVERAVLPAEEDSGPLADARRLLVRTVADTFDDRVPGMAAEMAFYVVLSLPPLLLVVLGSVGFVVSGLPEQDLLAIETTILDGMSTVLSPTTVDQVLAEPVRQLLREGRGDLLSLGVVLTLWAASRSVNVLLRTLIIAYDLEDRRPPWQRRLLALGLTLGAVVLAVVLLPLLVVGPDVAGEVLQFLGIDGGGLARFWPAAYWVVVGGAGLAALTWVYHVAPSWHTPWRRDLPGAVLALVVWLLASWAIRFYAREFATFATDDTFRGLAAPLVLLLWVYASGIAVLLGAEFNAEIERLWPTPEGPYDRPMPRKGEVTSAEVLRRHADERRRDEPRPPQ